MTAKWVKMIGCTLLAGLLQAGAFWIAGFAGYHPDIYNLGESLHTILTFVNGSIVITLWDHFVRSPADHDSFSRF
jgi:hypothetical protein